MYEAWKNIVRYRLDGSGAWLLGLSSNSWAAFGGCNLNAHTRYLCPLPNISFVRIPRLSRPLAFSKGFKKRTWVWYFFVSLWDHCSISTIWPAKNHPSDHSPMISVQQEADNPIVIDRESKRYKAYSSYL